MRPFLRFSRLIPRATWTFRHYRKKCPENISGDRI